jgi:hypothetical protein
MKQPKWMKRWLQQLSHPVQKYGYLFVNDIPDIIAAKKIYVVQEGTEPETLVFKCPCGCCATIQLNLLKDSSPRWRCTIVKKKINIAPSIVRRKGCKSHFWIQKGKVIWSSYL